jgi:hypothetical protein
MIKNKVHNLVIEELFEQTDQAMKNMKNGDSECNIHTKVKT